MVKGVKKGTGKSGVCSMFHVSVFSCCASPKINVICFTSLITALRNHGSSAQGLVALNSKRILSRGRSFLPFHCQLLPKSCNSLMNILFNLTHCHDQPQLKLSVALDECKSLFIISSCIGSYPPPIQSLPCSLSYL